MYVFEFWLCLQHVSMKLLILSWPVVPKLKPMLKLTSFMRWQCHKLTKCFYQNHLHFSAVLPPADNWTRSHIVEVLPAFGCSCQHFLALIKSCIAMSPYSKFEMLMNWLLICPPWNVTEDENGLFYNWYQLVFKENVKEYTMNWWQNTKKKRK